MKAVLAKTLVIIAGAFVAFGLWLGEVSYIKGWAGTKWAESYTWSAIPICILLAVLCSFYVVSPLRRPRRLLFIISASLITLVSYAVVREAILDVMGFNSLVILAFFKLTGIAPVISSVILFFMMPIGMAWLVNKFLAPLRAWTFLLVIVVLIAVLPLAYATIQFFPALSGDTNVTHAIKMGYPVFWMTLLTPIALRLGLRRDVSGKCYGSKTNSFVMPNKPSQFIQ